ncbi:patatin-like phospholipase family protein [Massilia varians]|nr:patatin-like phospholipase family protein [Massilia varians]
MSNDTRPRIALVLSGGGIRAMMFHLGVLRYLAERDALELVHRISTVSGGSLLVGLILQECEREWPSSQRFLSHVYPALRRKLCSRSLQWGAVRQLLRPWNFRYALSRANLLALALEKEWGVTCRVSDLPSSPELSINGTTAENGKRFRFKRNSMGDYSIGYASPRNFPLSSALAVSAAFPGGFGPLVLRADRFEWRRRPSWNAQVDSERVVDIGYTRLHLYDGGVYDNLGLEPFFDAGRGSAKHAGDNIIVSDAGAPLQPGFAASAVSPWRLKRVADIMSEQSRALRVRTFTHYLQTRPGCGAYIYIGTPVGQCSAGTCNPSTFASNYPTTLRRPAPEHFDAIVEHGYQVAASIDGESGLGIPVLPLTSRSSVG